MSFLLTSSAPIPAFRSIIILGAPIIFAIGSLLFILRDINLCQKQKNLLEFEENCRKTEEEYQQKQKLREEEQKKLDEEQKIKIAEGQKKIDKEFQQKQKLREEEQKKLDEESKIRKEKQKWIDEKRLEYKKIDDKTHINKKANKKQVKKWKALLENLEKHKPQNANPAKQTLIDNRIQQNKSYINNILEFLQKQSIVIECQIIHIMILNYLPEKENFAKKEQKQLEKINSFDQEYQERQKTINQLIQQYIHNFPESSVSLEI